MTTERSAGVALLLLFLFAHLALLPRTLEDIDSVNFALGVRHFDVARHQPHPPGYPVYIALSKVSTSVLRMVGVDAPAVRGLAIWSALGGAAALPALLLFFRRLEERSTLAWCAAAVAAASPLFWFSALRPLSDMAGFAAAMWTLALVTGSPTGREVLVAAFIAGMAIGIRSQTAVLTVPMLLLALWRARVARIRIGAAGACVMGALAWGIPLLAASGGMSAYLHALGTQAGEDFSGVVMLSTHRTVRVAVNALLNTFIWPWDWWLGIAVTVLAAIGAARLAWRAPRVVLTIFVAFVPYAVFHILFHETETTRYALPLIPVMAYLAMAAVEGLPARALPVAAIGIAAISLVQSVPASSVYARDGAPVFRAFDDIAQTAHGGDRVDTIGMHAIARRAAEWSMPILPARVATAPHGREWLPLVALWKSEPSARVWFVADPRRTDLALFDPRARDLARAYRWGFVEPPFVGGARPGDIDWYHMQPPGWMLDRGWSVTAEVGGVTARDGLGPHVAPATAWLMRRAEETTVVLGGRHPGKGGAPPIAVKVTLNGTPVETLTVAPGFFVRILTLPAGRLAGAAPYQPLDVTSDGVVSLEQFDAQPPGVPMIAYDAGWQEPEYNPALGRGWRWTAERSLLWVRPIGRDVTLRLIGESPLRYFDAAPHVRLLVGDREIGSIDPSADFDRVFTLPAAALAAANGRVALESSRFFVAGSARGGDQRHLALRIYKLSVD
ncbi:MAG TPA: hypothetical protein VNC21_08055 [Vicinamibacterales bacterium]|nr:hypothetical protein [Vicinamibacterales bacterium]